MFQVCRLSSTVLREGRREIFYFIECFEETRIFDGIQFELPEGLLSTRKLTCSNEPVIGINVIDR